MSRKIINSKKDELIIGNQVECNEFSEYFSGIIIHVNSEGQTTVEDEKNNCIHYVHCQWLKKTNPSRRDYK